jgi:hypothetical protein
MLRRERREIDITKRVAVHDEEIRVADERQRLARPSRRSEHGRRLPRISHPHVEVGAVADARGNRVGKMMKVQDAIADIVAGDVPENARHKRLPGDGNGGFRPHGRERPQPGAQARGKNER